MPLGRRETAIVICIEVTFRTLYAQLTVDS